ncbi:MAG: glycoside hydrolase family 2 TIM barrel-domain containing protein, partial [Bdellovibrionia bacterium]
SLNGPWQFAYDDGGLFVEPKEIENWTHTIEVPFAPESKQSGIGDTGFHRSCWYEREFQLESYQGRVLLHFGAVDYYCRVWVNDCFIGDHRGGHTPFTFDITEELIPEASSQKLAVCVLDDPHDLAKPRGKQDWQREPHSIWYPRTTGIWQTVWIEYVSKIHINRLRWIPQIERWEIGFEVVVSDIPAESGAHDELRLTVKLSCGSQILVDDTYEVIYGEVTRRIALSDPGIDDFRNELLWCPERPTLIDAELCLWQGSTLIDHVNSYTALRGVGVQRDRFMLNGRPYYMRLVLDQGYWTDTLMTAPSEEALRRDVELTKQMGFNGVRKHQKIEDPLYLYWADTLGLLVWAEMPSSYRFTHDSVERMITEWTEVINRDYSHPCIVVWVPFNESWGVPDLAEKPAHQNCVQALYHLTRTLDQSRPVIGNDGWESTATDIIGIHDYDNDPARILDRYGPNSEVADILVRRRPAGRMLTVEGHPHRGQPFMLTEFGGIAFASTIARHVPGAWGYDVSPSELEFQNKYVELLSAVNRIELFSGFCYTQLTDTFQEANGLLYADRTPKILIENIATATRGSSYIREGLAATTVRIEPPLEGSA